MSYHLAVDLGAGSGRIMALDLGGAAPALTEVHRFVSSPVARAGGNFWDLAALLDAVRAGLLRARAQLGRPAASIAVDSWGVDYALLDATGRPLGDPYFYRDARTDGWPERLRPRLSDASLFARTGSQPRSINTLYQLLAEKEQNPGRLAAARRLAFIPDLVAHALTGQPSSENTIAATSGLWVPGTRDWNRDLIAELGLPVEIFPALEEPGETVGRWDDTPVVLCASHDTASAIDAVAGEPGQAILSLGSWAIVSWVLREPVLNEAAGRAGFAVEGARAGQWRYARNHTGLWLLQQYRESAVQSGRLALGFAELETAAVAATPEHTVIAPDDPAFAHPLDMRAALADALVRRGHRPPDSDGGWVRLIYRSLALSFARSLRELENVTGEKVRSVRVIGGGAQSALLCQMIADASECPVVSGPVEATAWGNVLVQAAAINGGSVGAWRDRFRPVWAERTHCPRVSPELEAARAGH